MGVLYFFLATEPQEGWVYKSSQVKNPSWLCRSLHMVAPSPKKFPGHKNPASYAGYVRLVRVQSMKGFPFRKMDEVPPEKKPFAPSCS